MGLFDPTQESQAASEKKLKAYACELEQKLEERTRELAEARAHLSEAVDQQTATSEVLRVISSSPGDLKLVFETLLANATRLCEAKFGNLDLREGNSFRIAALHNAPPLYVEWRKRQPVIYLDGLPNVPLSRIVRTKAVQHVPDLTKDEAYIGRAPPIVALTESVERADAQGRRRDRSDRDLPTRNSAIH